MKKRRPRIDRTVTLNGDKCHRKHCRATLRIEATRDGRIIATCDLCERNKAGVCRGCPSRIVQRNRASLKMWCDTCLRRREVEQSRRWYWRDADHARAIARRCYRNQGTDRRAAKLVYEREHKKQHPVVRDDFQRAYDREWNRQHYSIPANRERRNRLGRERRAKMLAPARDQQRTA